MPHSLKHLPDDLRQRILSLNKGDSLTLVFPSEKERRKMYLIIRRWLREYDRGKSLDDQVAKHIQCANVKDNKLRIRRKNPINYTIE